MVTSDFVKRTPLRFDAYSLKREWLKLSNKIAIVDRQISLSHTPDCPPDQKWSQGNGSLFWKHKNENLLNSEKSFSCLNTEMEVDFPYLWSVCNKVKATYKIGRIRFMVMENGYTYPTHHDFERRWHLPIITNVDSFLYFRNSSLNMFKDDLLVASHGFGFHLPDDGFLYEIEAGTLHTACNPGNHNEAIARVHLVFNEAID